MSVERKNCSIVSVYWVDSCGFDSGWVNNDELDSLKPKEITTVGHLVRETNNYVLIAPTIGDDQNFGSLCIPKCSVLKINILTESEDEID